jgi:hypothetical protein
MTYFVFIEFDGPYGRSRMTRGFTTPEARQAWASQQHPCEGDEWSDYEEWEDAHSEWPHVQILA